MGRLRYIEPEVWQNPELRRLGLAARNVFLYLFSAHADDEGRFKWDPYAVLEGAFGRGDPVTEEQVAEAMCAIAEAGMLLRYGEAGEFGFLTGWFAHQSMHKNVRRQSALPRPPVEVGSWVEADEVREAYGKACNLSGFRCSYREALRWYAEQQRKSSVGSTETLRRSAEGFPEEVEVEVGGVEGGGEGKNGNDKEVLSEVVGQRGVEDPPKPSTERTSADSWLASLFNVNANSLPDPWPQLLPDWEHRFGGTEVSAVAEIAHGKFCGEATVHLGKVRSYMRRTLENRKTDRDTTKREPTPTHGQPRWQGWPADLNECDLFRRLTEEEVDALAASPDWSRLPPLRSWLHPQQVERVEDRHQELIGARA